MNIKVIGIGGSGNKSTYEAMVANVISADDLMIINSTRTDIPVELKESKNVYILSDKADGCAKEADTAESLAIDAIDKNRIPFKEFCKDADEVIIVGSPCGGTGSGAIPVIADHISNELGITVRVMPLIGYGIDETELKNIVKFFTNLSEDYLIEEICNEKFLPAANNNLIAAEKLANLELAQRLLLIQGKEIIESEQNIDRADLLKTCKTPGRSITLFAEFDRLKNVEEYNKVVNAMIDDYKGFDIINPSQRRMAVVFSLSNTPQDAIDFTHQVLKKRLGEKVKEIFPHIQNVSNLNDDEDFVPSNKKDFIAVYSVGSLMPQEAIDKYYQKYKEAKSKKQKETFFSKKYDLDDDDNDGSVYDRKKRSDSKFFNNSKFSNKASRDEVAATSTHSEKSLI